MKAIGYIRTTEEDDKYILSIFQDFDCFIAFHCEGLGNLTRITICENQGGSAFNVEISSISFGLKYDEMFKAFSDYLINNKISLYIVNTDKLASKIVKRLDVKVDCGLINEDGSIILCEEFIDSLSNSFNSCLEYLCIKKDNIRVELYTSEKLGFEEPHVHVKVNNELSFKISLLDGIKTLKVYNPTKAKFEKKSKEFIADNIVKIRKKWNDFSNNVKFVLDRNGNPTSQTYKLNN